MKPQGFTLELTPLGKILAICLKGAELSFDRGVPVLPVVVPTDTSNILPSPFVNDSRKPVLHFPI